MKPRPVVLISGSTEERGVEFKDVSVSLSLNYPRAIEAAGGLPHILPCLPDREFVAESVRNCDGVLLTGGDDVQPELYRKDSLPEELQKTVTAVAPERDLFELMLVDEVFRQRKPLLAICRGQQILNVALGGTLIVDIKTESCGALNHNRTDKKDRIVHEVDVMPGSILAYVCGSQMKLGVNSSHHQAVANIPKPLSRTAVSIDGIVEGLELEPGARHLLPYLLAVQFHPERLCAQHVEHLKLFESFTDACHRHRRKYV
jgi:putative glutamine amidotransferase